MTLSLSLPFRSRQLAFSVQEQKKSERERQRQRTILFCPWRIRATKINSNRTTWSSTRLNNTIKISNNLIFYSRHSPIDNRKRNHRTYVSSNAESHLVRSGSTVREGKEKKNVFRCCKSCDDGCPSLVLVVGRQRLGWWANQRMWTIVIVQGLNLCLNTVLEWIPISRSFFSRNSSRPVLIPALRMTQPSHPTTVTLALGIGESARLSTSVHL